MIFSSFHLMRDAEEREQLTYLYLSLIHESKENNSTVTDESKDMILQTLFSRTETGLLNQAQGPQIPTAEVIKMLKPSS